MERTKAKCLVQDFARSGALISELDHNVKGHSCKTIYWLVQKLNFRKNYENIKHKTD